MTDTATAETITNEKTGLTDSIKAAFSGDAPIQDKFKAFYKAKPLAAIALGAVAGIALLNTLRGK